MAKLLVGAVENEIARVEGQSYVTIVQILRLVKKPHSWMIRVLVISLHVVVWVELLETANVFRIVKLGRM